MAYRVLVVEDEKHLREVLCDFFKSKGDCADAAKNGMAALELFSEHTYDAVLLDIMMPELDGFSVCRAMRQKSDVPIVFLTALSDEDEKLYGYELGADDYVTKPFYMSVLYAKLSALINRRRGNIRTGDRLSVGRLTVELSSHRAFADGRELSLTPKEYALLECLMMNKGIVMSREQLLIKCWGYDYEGEARVVDTQIRRLREKLGTCADCIRTVIKAGYRLEEKE